MTTLLCVACESYPHRDQKHSFRHQENAKQSINIIDGDTLVWAGQRIRLYGIDAPEARQICKRGDGTEWPCGRAATQALIEKIEDATIHCQGKEYDRYHRLIAICFLGDIDLNEWLVVNGWAVSYRRYSEKYIHAEVIARERHSGLWEGTFIMPWKWRTNQHTNTPKSSPH